MRGACLDLVDHLHQMRDLGDRAADLGGVLTLDDLVHLVQPQTDKDLALAGGATDRRSDLLDLDGGHCRLLHNRGSIGFRLGCTRTAATQQVGNLLATTLSDRLRRSLLGQRVKRSFGSAFKLVDFKHVGDSATIVTLTLILFLLAPPSKPFVDGFSSSQLWASLQRRLLPEDAWFGMFGENVLLGRPNDLAISRISTGALPAPTVETRDREPLVDPNNEAIGR